MEFTQQLRGIDAEVMNLQKHNQLLLQQNQNEEQLKGLSEKKTVLQNQLKEILEQKLILTERKESLDQIKKRASLGVVFDENYQQE